MPTYPGTDSTKYFREYAEAFRLSDEDLEMAAPNKQPAGKRPGPAAVHTHEPFSDGKPDAGANSTVKPGHTKGIVTKPTGKNKNRLH